MLVRCIVSPVCSLGLSQALSSRVRGLLMTAPCSTSLSLAPQGPGPYTGHLPHKPLPSAFPSRWNSALIRTLQYCASPVCCMSVFLFVTTVCCVIGCWYGSREFFSTHGCCKRIVIPVLGSLPFKGVTVNFDRDERSPRQGDGVMVLLHTSRVYLTEGKGSRSLAS